MRLTTILSLLPLLAAPIASIERNLPADLQVDLIFPRNDTYALVQWFPVVIGVKNLAAVWPLDMSLEVLVRSINLHRPQHESDELTTKFGDLYYEDFRKAVNSTPENCFFHIPSVSLTNNTSGEFVVLWRVNIKSRCFDNATDAQPNTGALGWHNGPNSVKSRAVRFTTEPGAQLPDIEAAANACPEPSNGTTAVVRITDMKKTFMDGEACPVFETNIIPIGCGYRSVAAELAANVSSKLLGKSGLFQRHMADHYVAMS